MTDYSIKGRSPIYRPNAAAGGAFAGASLDNLNISVASPASGAVVLPQITNIEYDTDTFVSTASGSGFFAAGKQVLKIPAGLDGIYHIGFYAFIGGTGSSFSWQCGLRADDQYSGTIAGQLTLQSGTLVDFSGMSNSVSRECAASGGLDLPLVEGDVIGLWIRQDSGGARYIGYIGFYLRRLGPIPA